MKKIEIFTIVLNGMPYIKHHLSEFEKIRIPWTWHIVEGIASHAYDTAWCAHNGGKINEKFYDSRFLSVDGTSIYIDSISDHSNVKVYRKGDFWDGKLEMVRAPMQNLEYSNDTILFQIDVDELWTVENIHKIIDMYDRSPNAQCAYYYCYYFLGPNRYVISDNTYGTGIDHWPRTWRLSEGSYWQSHEPSKLIGPLRDVISRDQTLARGITFEHYAYASEQAVEFKEYYYGYRNALTKWRSLQSLSGIVDASDYLDWIKPWSSQCITDEWKGPKLTDNLC